MLNSLSRQKIIIISLIFIIVILAVVAFLYLENKKLSDNIEQRNEEQKKAEQLHQEAIANELNNIKNNSTGQITEPQVSKLLDLLKTTSSVSSVENTSTTAVSNTNKQLDSLKTSDSKKLSPSDVQKMLNSMK